MPAPGMHALLRLYSSWAGMGGKWLKMSALAAVLLAGAGALDQYRLEAESAASDRSAFVECQVAAQLFFDVKWAAACMTQVGQASSGQADGHAECDLPEAQAAAVNAWLNEAQAQCTAEAAHHS